MSRIGMLCRKMVILCIKDKKKHLTWMLQYLVSFIRRIGDDNIGVGVIS